MGNKSVDRFLRNRNLDSEELSGTDTHEMEQIVTQLSEQLKLVNEQLVRLAERQEGQDRALSFINNKFENEKTAAPTENQINLDLFRIPDPIKSIPDYDGNRKQLNSWLSTVEDTLNVFIPLVSESQYQIYLQAISNKVKGKAKDALCLAGNPRNFQEMKEILLETLGDKQELSFYKSQLWATKQTENTTVHSYFNKIKENVQHIKALAKQNVTYNYSWPAISAFIDEDALAAFISGLRKPYFGYAQAARPKTIEDAYAFLCKFNSNEIISGNSRKINNITQSGQNKNNQSNQYNQNYKKTNSVKEYPTPMETDASLRSRNSSNRKVINTHELHSKDEEQGTENQEDPYSEDDVDASNFQEDPGEKEED